MQGRKVRASSELPSWRDKVLLKVDRKAISTANNNDSVCFEGSVPAWRPGGPSSMLAGRDLKGRPASSKTISVRFSIPIITDGPDVITVAMNKGVSVFAGSSHVLSLHHGVTVSVIVACWARIIVLP